MSACTSLVASIARAAHRAGLAVYGHIPDEMSTNDAIDAGYDGISHVDMLTARGLTDVNATDPAIVATFKKMASRRVFLDPTLSLFDPDASQDPDLARLPPELAPLEDALERQAHAVSADRAKARGGKF